MNTTPQQQPSDAINDFKLVQFQILQALLRVQTLSIVQVMAVQAGGVGPIGNVDVLPLVNMIDGDFTPVEHGIVSSLPYCRVQGGPSAFIVDPVEGDIGLAGFCSRDISVVKQTLAQANPGSLRRFNFADGVYLLTCLSSGNPTQYVEMLPGAGGINIKSPGTVNINGAQITAAGEIIDALGKVLGTHVHSGVQSGGSNTGPPV